ncbi:MAG: basic amino acid ABC transporter substrate-binding protein [Thermoplasmatota archaeon]
MNNKKEIVSIVLIVAIALSVVALSGCVEEDNGNVITVGTSADFPPFEYMEGGEIVGFDIEMVTAVLESLDYQVEVQDIAFDGLIGSLQTGKIDVVAAAMSIDPERDVDFTIPYFEADLSVLVMADSELLLNDTNYIEELTNLTLGAQTGTTGAQWVLDNFDEEQLRRYETYTEAVLDLLNGNLDAVIIDKPVGEVFAEEVDLKIAYTIITGEQYGLAVKKGNTELLEELNTALADFMESEEWSELVRKYFG